LDYNLKIKNKRCRKAKELERSGVLLCDVLEEEKGILLYWRDAKFNPTQREPFGKKEGKISISVKITQNTHFFFFWARLLSFVHDSHTA